MFGLSPGELVVVLVIVFIIFGKGKLPELGTALGEGIRNFKKAMRDSKALDVTGDSRHSVGSAEGEPQRTLAKSTSPEAVNSAGEGVEGKENKR